MEVVTLSSQAGFFSEPSVAVNMHNPQQVVAAYQGEARVAYSVDGGQHWEPAKGTASTNYRVSGDVSITFDNRGNAILCYLAFDTLGTFNYWGHNSTRNGLFVRRSPDGGRTWEESDVAVIEHPATEPGLPWEDKPYIMADNANGPHAGNLYVGWTRWTLEDSEILFSRSTDGGKTWSKAKEINKKRGLPRDDNGALEGFSGVVGPDGTLYVVWSDGNHIILTTSKDGGETFSPPRDIMNTAPIMFQLQNLSRANGFAQIAADPHAGARRGRIYVTWGDYRNGDADIFLSSSSDGGRHWTPAVRVNDDPVHDGADQFFEWMAVDPTDGAVNVIFYDRRRDPQNQKQIVTLARSTDGGRSFANYAWTEDQFDASGVFLGDYTGLAAFGGRVYGVWTEKKSSGTADGMGRSEEPSGERAEGHEASPKTGNTIVRVGIADFGADGRLHM